jgi:hypothetical protein
MTETVTTTQTSADGAPDGPVPATPPQLAEIQPPAPGEAVMAFELTLSEVGCIAASIQTAVRSGWIRKPSHLNVANSVLRKFHEAKLKLAETLS